MELLFLGTSASEGYPDPFCKCNNCQTARATGGPNLRKLSSALIDGELLIDFGPELMAAARDHHLSLGDVQYCLQTHEHSDHLDPALFRARTKYCSVFGVPTLHWYASQSAIDLVSTRLKAALPDEGFQSAEVENEWNIKAHTIEPFQTFAIGPFQVTSVLANHGGPNVTALLHIIERDGRVLFYATDTGVLPDETWHYLEQLGIQFNVVVIDHTFGLTDRAGSHLNSALCIEQITSMRNANLLAADARIYATHLAHHSNPPHDELVIHAQQNGYDVAYDGLVVEI